MHNYMIEKSQVNTQTNKKGKEHSKCAGQEKKFCVSKIKKESMCLENVDTKQTPDERKKRYNK